MQRPFVRGAVFLALSLFFLIPAFSGRFFVLATAMTFPKQAITNLLANEQNAVSLPPAPSKPILSPLPQKEEASLSEIFIPSDLLLDASDRGGKIYAETIRSSESKQILKYGVGYIKNDTTLSAQQILSLAKMQPDFQVDTNSKEPQVLIFHTHGSESFDRYNCGYFHKSATARSTDNKENMVAVGNALCASLEKAGIAYIHDTNLFDSPSYNGSYQRSAAAVSDYLAKYPSIKVVLDIHRDAVYADDGGWRKFVCEVEGKTAAQIMIISGCENGSLGNPQWDKNLRFAARLEDRLEKDWPGITRPLYFCYRNYNQHLSTGALLIEVGTHGNALSEAVYSGYLLGESLARLFLEG